MVPSSAAETEGCNGYCLLGDKAVCCQCMIGYTIDESKKNTE